MPSGGTCVEFINVKLFKSPNWPINDMGHILWICDEQRILKHFVRYGKNKNNLSIAYTVSMGKIMSHLRSHASTLKFLMLEKPLPTTKIRQNEWKVFESHTFTYLYIFLLPLKSEIPFLCVYIKSTIKPLLSLAGIFSWVSDQLGKQTCPQMQKRIQNHSLQHTNH